jgi:hypothetical protein
MLRYEPKWRGEHILKRELARDYRRWSFGAYSYGLTYFTVRIVLIVASAIVAGKETLSPDAPIGLV